MSLLFAVITLSTLEVISFHIRTAKPDILVRNPVPRWLDTPPTWNRTAISHKHCQLATTFELVYVTSRFSRCTSTAVEAANFLRKIKFAKLNANNMRSNFIVVVVGVVNTPTHARLHDRAKEKLILNLCALPLPLSCDSPASLAS